MSKATTNVVSLSTPTEQWRDVIVAELTGAAKRVRKSTARPLAVGIIIVTAEGGDRIVYSSYEGPEALALIAGCHMLARRIEDSLDIKAAAPTE